MQADARRSLDITTCSSARYQRWSTRIRRISHYNELFEVTKNDSGKHTFSGMNSPAITAPPTGIWQGETPAHGGNIRNASVITALRYFKYSVPVKEVSSSLRKAERTSATAVAGFLARKQGYGFRTTKYESRSVRVNLSFRNHAPLFIVADYSQTYSQGGR